MCHSIATKLGLQKDIYDLTILINSPPEVMLLTVDLHEDFIDVERVTLAQVPSLESLSIQSSELDTP
jgi:hypothetical protein